MKRREVESREFGRNWANLLSRLGEEQESCARTTTVALQTKRVANKSPGVNWEIKEGIGEEIVEEMEVLSPVEAWL